MTTYSIEELKLVIQSFLPLFFVGVFATTLIIFNDGYPWYTLIGTALGLSIIMISWTGKKYAIFFSFLLLCAIIFSPLSLLYS